MKTLVSTIFFACVLATTFAQTPATQKIGYADWDYIFSQMPEFKQVDTDLKAHSAQLQSQIEAKNKEFEAKYRAWQNLPANTADAVRADKQRELEDMNASIQKFQQDAQASYQKKQNDLMEPVFSKVGKAIEAVAKEQGYTFIINPQMLQGGDILLYSDPQYDISDLVLKKLGVTPAPKPANPR